MPRPVLKQRVGRAASAALLAFLVAGVASCGAQDEDVARGRQVFLQKCGSCHQLAEAATTGTQGPDLDAAFREARANGMDADTIAGVVKIQVEHPRPSSNVDPSVSMPAGLVEGQDLDAVAAYVGSVAGVPGIAPPKAPGGPGGQVFAQNGCSGCHTLAAAQSSATTGPDLDEVIPGQSKSYIEKQIVDPNSDITPGYPPNVMPQTFGETLDSDQLKLLVDFLYTSAGSGSKSAGK